MKAAVLVIFSVLLNIQTGGCLPPPSCSHPPFQWCSSLATAVQCGVRTATYNNIYILSYATLPLKSWLLSNEKCVRYNYKKVNLVWSLIFLKSLHRHHFFKNKNSSRLTISFQSLKVVEHERLFSIFSHGARIFFSALHRITSGTQQVVGDRMRFWCAPGSGGFRKFWFSWCSTFWYSSSLTLPNVWGKTLTLKSVLLRKCSQSLNFHFFCFFPRLSRNAFYPTSQSPTRKQIKLTWWFIMRPCVHIADDIWVWWLSPPLSCWMTSWLSLWCLMAMQG